MSIKQTAVEWLIERCEDADLTEDMWEQIKATAKQKELEQIVKAYRNGYNNADSYHKNTYENDNNTHTTAE